MYYPIVIVDNFYRNFSEVKKFVNEITFYDKGKNTIPGQESELINEINYNFFQECTKKILSVFYDREKIQQIQFDCRTRFRKTFSMGKDYSNDGWIHVDEPNKLSAIFYLKGMYDEGTSFYVKKNLSFDFSHLNLKKQMYDKIEPNFNQYNKALMMHNDQFSEILKVPLIENRMIIFDSSIAHKADGHGTTEVPRIIQTFFFNKIITESCPIPEINRINL